MIFVDMHWANLLTVSSAAINNDTAQLPGQPRGAKIQLNETTSRMPPQVDEPMRPQSSAKAACAYFNGTGGPIGNEKFDTHAPAGPGSGGTSGNRAHSAGHLGRGGGM